MANTPEVPGAAGAELGKRETGKPAGEGEHSGEGKEKPFTYVPTVSDIRKSQQWLRDLANEQSPGFHDKTILKDPGAVLKGLDEQKKNAVQIGDKDADSGQLTIQQRPGFFLDKGLDGEPLALRTFNFRLDRKDGSVDQAIVDSTGRVMQERTENVTGVTNSYYRPDGTLYSERHRRQGYFDQIRYDNKGELPIATHIENGNTTIDDDQQKDGSWKKTTVVKGDDGKVQSTATLITKGDSSTNLDYEEPNGDHLIISKDSHGTQTAYDQMVTKNGVTKHIFLKNGDYQEESLNNI